MESIDKYYRVYASVNLDNIYANMKELKDNTVPGTQMVAVVKTDGYGHGAIPVSETIDELVAAYAVATIDEALNLRRHNITKPIYILGFVYEHRIKDAIINDIRMTVFDIEMAKAISKMAVELDKKAYVHIYSNNCILFRKCIYPAFESRKRFFGAYKRGNRKQKAKLCKL